MKTFLGDDTIIYVAEDDDLKNALIEWCKRNEKKIIFGEPDSSDILAIAAFAVVADKNIVGSLVLDNYKEILEDTPVLFTNNLSKKEILEQLNIIIGK